MSEFLQIVEQRLDEWVRWQIYFCDMGLGLPRKSIEAQLVDGGGILIKGTAPYHPPENRRAKEVHRLVRQLSEQNEMLAQVLHAYYFGQGNHKQRAHCLGMSYTHFRTQVDCAKHWLAGGLSADRKLSL